ncbi:MAG: 50S ribosomal protein L4 [Verrucomicrobia bacterium]|nr:50S ribosomal protein L4 [Verrucomicrobiota bacterium]MDA1064947.1 50S ribosomal protein L4 [Verrucomicrobiota bacterium]
MKLKTFKSDGSSSGNKEFAFPSFEGDRGVQAIKEVIIAIRANKRFGTASTKTRAEVRGGGKKPFRQKGTGMARQGSSRSPLHSGGGVAMGPKPRDYSKKVNKKVKSLAFQRALFDRAVDGSLVVIKEFKIAEPKTKLFVDVIKQVVPTRGSILIVDSGFQDEVVFASRNIAGLDTEDAAYLNTLQLSLYSTIVITEAAIATLMQRMEADNS